ncbi:MAG: VOC family protein [Gaiellaceae bacterium]
MSPVTHVGRVMVPVADQDAAIEFYSEMLGFELAADVPFGDGDRWVEVAPPGGGTTLALVPSRGEYQAGHMTGIALDTTDARAVHAELGAKGVDVDAETMGGDGTVPLLFFFRDQDGNSLMVVESM